MLPAAASMGASAPHQVAAPAMPSWCTVRIWLLLLLLRLGRLQDATLDSMLLHKQGESCSGNACSPSSEPSECALRQSAGPTQQCQLYCRSETLETVEQSCTCMMEVAVAVEAADLARGGQPLGSSCGPMYCI